MGIGARIKEILKQKNKTILWLAEKSGVSKNTLYTITKRDNTNIRHENLKKIADALEVSVEDLLERDGDNDVNNSNSKTKDVTTLFISRSSIDAYKKLVEEIVNSEKFKKEIDSLLTEKFAKDYIKTEHLLKLGFNLEEKYADKLTEYADRTVMFSIPELVVYGGITKDELIKAIDEVSENIYEKFGEVYTFDYDIDGLYPDGVATLYDAYAKDDESVYDRVSRLDALFCGLIE